jgi:hypothetical protein
VNHQDVSYLKSILKRQKKLISALKSIFESLLHQHQQEENESHLQHDLKPPEETIIVDIDDDKDEGTEIDHQPDNPLEPPTEKNDEPISTKAEVDDDKDDVHPTKGKKDSTETIDSSNPDFESVCMVSSLSRLSNDGSISFSPLN